MQGAADVFKVSVSSRRWAEATWLLSTCYVATTAWNDLKGQTTCWFLFTYSFIFMFVYTAAHMLCVCVGGGLWVKGLLVGNSFYIMYSDNGTQVVRLGGQQSPLNYLWDSFWIFEDLHSKLIKIPLLNFYTNYMLRWLLSW